MTPDELAFAQAEWDRAFMLVRGGYERQGQGVMQAFESAVNWMRSTDGPGCRPGGGSLPLEALALIADLGGGAAMLSALIGPAALGSIVAELATTDNVVRQAVLERLVKAGLATVAKENTMSAFLKRHLPLIGGVILAGEAIARIFGAGDVAALIHWAAEALGATGASPVSAAEWGSAITQAVAAGGILWGALRKYVALYQAKQAGK